MLKKTELMGHILLQITQKSNCKDCALFFLKVTCFKNAFEFRCGGEVINIFIALFFPILDHFGTRYVCVCVCGLLICLMVWCDNNYFLCNLFPPFYFLEIISLYLKKGPTYFALGLLNFKQIRGWIVCIVVIGIAKWLANSWAKNMQYILKRSLYEPTYVVL